MFEYGGLHSLSVVSDNDLDDIPDHSGQNLERSTVATLEGVGHGIADQTGNDLPQRVRVTIA